MDPPTWRPPFAPRIAILMACGNRVSDLAQHRCYVSRSSDASPVDLLHGQLQLHHGFRWGLFLFLLGFETDVVSNETRMAIGSTKEWVGQWTCGIPARQAKRHRTCWRTRARPHHESSELRIRCWRWRRCVGRCSWPCGGLHARKELRRIVRSRPEAEQKPCWDGQPGFLRARCTHNTPEKTDEALP